GCRGSAPRRSAPRRSAPVRFHWTRTPSLRLALARSAPLRSAWSLRFASTGSARPRFALKRIASLRFALARFAPLRSAPLRSALLRSGRMLGFLRRHAFQAATSRLSNATCLAFAIGASRCRYGSSAGCGWYARPEVAVRRYRAAAACNHRWRPALTLFSAPVPCDVIAAAGRSMRISIDGMIGVMANRLETKWTNWRPFPDPAKGGLIVAPIGPGCYELRLGGSGRLVLFGSAGCVAYRMT